MTLILHGLEDILLILMQLIDIGTDFAVNSDDSLFVCFYPVVQRVLDNVLPFLVVNGS